MESVQVRKEVFEKQICTTVTVEVGELVGDRLDVHWQQPGGILYHIEGGGSHHCGLEGFFFILRIKNGH